jgi:hypothetical protein
MREDMVTDIPRIPLDENTIFIAALTEEKYSMLFLRWNLIKILDETGFHLRSISIFGRLLSKIS